MKAMKKTEKGELNIKLESKVWETEEGSKKEKTKVELQWKTKSVEKPKSYSSKKQDKEKKKKHKNDEGDEMKGADEKDTPAESNPESGKDLSELQHELEKLNRKIQALLDKKVEILMQIKEAETVSAPMA